ncbi:hypothetical protein GSI_12106 [Ganoderma sinense ZZ0214-1]|uniref:Uncharacterized protein n=1 Tax=Ganoderma sinense ZZ0214-1 TaxID=1077348 RepID=A0A2G8RXV7_9APHY|nr:hypothetical protein GSI_12106 [Ganoderma sinense ZZ0214-1]
MVRRNNHTWDLLGAIPRRSDLAKVVKEVTVRAYTWEDREYVSEMGCLIDALEVLPNVFFPEDTEVNTHDDAIIRLIDTKAPAITRLSVSGEVLWTCQSLSSFRALQELELIYTNTFNGLGEILVHCATLTSLTILPTECAYLGQLFTALEAHPGALSNLSAFKYLAPSEDSCMVTVERVISLCKFLKNKRCLRRLDVKFDGNDGVERPLLELLPELPALAVLGFSFVRGARWMPEDIIPFERAIPAHVSALRLEHFLDRGMGVVDDGLDPYTSCREAWLKLFKSRMSLRYLHIVEFPTRATDTDLELDSGNRGLTFHRLTAEDLPSSLELFGNRADIHPIIRAASAPNGASASRSKFGPCWSLEKIAFRTVEDFGCADWEWLFRWHDFNSLDFFRTGVLQHGVYGQWAMSG